MRIATSKCGEIIFHKFNPNGPVTVGIPRHKFELVKENTEGRYSYWCAKCPSFTSENTLPLGIHHHRIGARNMCTMHIAVMLKRYYLAGSLQTLLTELGFELQSWPGDVFASGFVVVDDSIESLIDGK